MNPESLELRTHYLYHREINRIYIAHVWWRRRSLTVDQRRESIKIVWVYPSRSHDRPMSITLLQRINDVYCIFKKKNNWLKMQILRRDLQDMQVQVQWLTGAKIWTENYISTRHTYFMTRINPNRKNRPRKSNWLYQNFSCTIRSIQMSLGYKTWSFYRPLSRGVWNLNSKTVITCIISHQIQALKAKLWHVAKKNPMNFHQKSSIMIWI